VEYRPSRADTKAIAAIEAELAVVHPTRNAVAEVLPEIAKLLRTENMVVVAPAPMIEGFYLERFESTLPDARRLHQLFADFMARATRRYAWYDPIRPEPSQRNVVIEALELIPPGELEASDIYRHVLLPVRFHAHRQPRVLVCEGPSLLAWIGSFQDGAVDARHRALLARLVPALKRRLATERKLQAGARRLAALEAALEHLGAPALVVGANGTVHEANQAACTLLDATGRELHHALRERIAGRPARWAFELTPLRAEGVPTMWLAILRPASAEQRIRAGVDKATARWALTPRQRAVLEQIIHGHATVTIAAILGISERAVELHVTAILDRVGVDNRTALVAAALLL